MTQTDFMSANHLTKPEAENKEQAIINYLKKVESATYVQIAWRLYDDLHLGSSAVCNLLQKMREVEFKNGKFKLKKEGLNE